MNKDKEVFSIKGKCRHDEILPINFNLSIAIMLLKMAWKAKWRKKKLNLFSIHYLDGKSYRIFITETDK